MNKKQRQPTKSRIRLLITRHLVFKFILAYEYFAERTCKYQCLQPRSQGLFSLDVQIEMYYCSFIFYSSITHAFENYIYMI